MNDNNGLLHSMNKESPVELASFVDKQVAYGKAKKANPGYIELRLGAAPQILLLLLISR